MTGSIVFILKGYPRLSETFIAQEILALERRGIPLRIVSLRRPTDKHIHPIHREIKAPVAYLPEYLYQEPLRVLRGWWKARRLPGYKTAFRTWLGDLRRDFTTNRGRRFGQACVLAAELPKDTRRLHAHFIHTPASVAFYTHLVTGIPWSCSAHAKDIWTSPAWEKAEKLASMDWLVTCTASGHAHLESLAPRTEKLRTDKVALVYHGLDFTRFPPPTARSDFSRVLTLLSVGRLVPKKGYAVLLDALAQLPPGIDWRLRHVGGGPLGDELKAQAAKLGIAQRIDWLGALPQEQVLEEYRRADLFVLASRVAEDGDRDGLPNVLMEAQSQRLAVVSTRISGVPELVIDGETGLLAPPDDAPALGTAIAALLSDRDRRARLAEAGFQRVHARFAAEHSIGDLERRFRADLV